MLIIENKSLMLLVPTMLVPGVHIVKYIPIQVFEYIHASCPEYQYDCCCVDTCVASFIGARAGLKIPQTNTIKKGTYKDSIDN